MSVLDLRTIEKYTMQKREKNLNKYNNKYKDNKIR